MGTGEPRPPWGKHSMIDALFPYFVVACATAIVVIGLLTI